MARPETTGGQAPQESGAAYRHTAAYVVARGLPGLINLLSLGLYTRLLAPEAFGEYALAISGITLLTTVGFYWLEIGLVRFNSKQADPTVLLATVLRAFVWACFGAGAVGIVVLLVTGVRLSLAFISLLVALSQAWHNLNLQLARSRLDPRRFARLSILQSIQVPVFAVIFVALGLGAEAILLGILASLLTPALHYFRADWGEAAKRPLDGGVRRELLAYGFPLAMVYAMRFIVNSSDRFMIAAMLGTADAGFYSAAGDLARKSLGAISTIIQLGGFPLIMRAFERGGSEAGGKAYAQNLSLLIAVCLPAMSGLIVLAPHITGTFFPGDYAEAGATLTPIVAVATFVALVKGVGFDVAFHITKRTRAQVLIVFLAAVLNVALNLLWIPRHGIIGAAYATLVTHTAALAASVTIGRRLIKLPFPFANLSRTTAATLLMVLALQPTLGWHGPVALGAQVLLGATVFGLAAAALKLPPFHDALRRLRPTGAPGGQGG